MQDYRHGKRITKYNPAYRNAQGAYLRPEWTAISDVGRVFEGELFTQQEYLRVEAAYVQAAYLLLAGAAPVMLVDLERWASPPEQERESALFQAWQALEEGALVTSQELGRVVQLILREHTWCSIVHHPSRVRLRFGYDYYMYVHYDQMPNETFTAIEALGLFVD